MLPRDAPLTQIRKTIARRLSESIGPIPTFYLTAEFDMERVAEMRTAMAAMGDEFKVSFNDIILKAVATALAQHPEVNAHWLGDKIRYFNRVHVGMAVAIEDGLITPVIFDADRKRMSEISREARELVRRGLDVRGARRHGFHGGRDSKRLVVAVDDAPSRRDNIDDARVTGFALLLQKIVVQPLQVERAPGENHEADDKKCQQHAGAPGRNPLRGSATVSGSAHGFACARSGDTMRMRSGGRSRTA